MKKLIYFTDKDLVKAFCQNGELVDKNDFISNPQNYKKCVAVCFGGSHSEQIAVAKYNNILYIYIDNCYFGNLNSYYTDHKPKKNFYRIVYNDTILRDITKRADDRLLQQFKFLKDNFEIDNFISDFKYQGTDIVIVPPFGKVSLGENLNPEVWKSKVMDKLKDCRYNIIIRERSNLRSRPNRFTNSPITKLFESAYATISYSSMAAVESVIFGVPSFIYTPEGSLIDSAAAPVSRLSLDNINNRLFPENRYQWLSHLAYGQFSRDEIANGLAKRNILKGR